MVRRGRGRDLCLRGVSPARARRVCACRSRYDLSSDMLFEDFRRYLEELQCIQSAVEDGGFPLSNPNFGRVRSHYFFPSDPYMDQKS